MNVRKSSVKVLVLLAADGDLAILRCAFVERAALGCFELGFAESRTQTILVDLNRRVVGHVQDQTLPDLQVQDLLEQHTVLAVALGKLEERNARSRDDLHAVARSLLPRRFLTRPLLRLGFLALLCHGPHLSLL